VRGIVHEFNSGLGFVSEIMPLDLGFVSAFAGRLLRAATRYLDETIFAYSLLRRNEPLWDVCSEGIGYYFQNTREILKTSVWTMLVSAVVTILSWIVFVAIWSVVLFPLVRTLTVSHLGSIYDPSAGSGAPGDPSTAVAVLGAIFGALILTAITVRLVSEAFLHPVYLTMVMTKYLVTIQMQPLDPSYQRFFGSARAVSLRNVVSQIDATRFGRA
ncbi:MAG TPA: hypothetical protein VF407_19170, partial [Polyangiaceae bacterium]